MQIRRAQPADASAIGALYALLVPGDANISVVPERIAALQMDPHNHLLVAEIDGSLSGSVFLTICLDPMYGFQPYGVLENIIVLPAARRSGIGAALMNAVERMARDAHCTKLMLLSSQARSEAHRFFQRGGFDGERKRGFVKYLNRGPHPRP
jgi:N-acetylglutamate synthase-like GNAT family acetyltransferase